jgi:hypothetical protein
LDRGRKILDRPTIEVTEAEISIVISGVTRAA